MNQVGPEWGPRPPKSAFRLWSRFVFQWLWGIPYVLVLIAAPIILAIANVLYELLGRGRAQARPPRRLWLSLDRLRRERNTDVGQTEARLRERLVGHETAAGGGGGKAQAIIRIDDSYFRQIGASRALQIAAEYGWYLPEDTKRYAPTWLLLHRSTQEPQSHDELPSRHQAQRHKPQPHMQARPPHQAEASASYGPIPAGRHSIAVQGERIRIWGAGKQDRDLAHAVIPGTTEKPSKSTCPPFTIHSGPDGGLLCSVQPAGEGTYEVYSADGAPLARITRCPGRVVLGPRRVRWTVQPGYAPPPVIGKVGTWYSWLSYYLFSPLWAPVWLCMVVCTLLNADSDDMSVKGPARTRWRASGSRTVMEYRGANRVYHLEPELSDVRVLYAQAYLHQKDR